MKKYKRLAILGFLGFLCACLLISIAGLRDDLHKADLAVVLGTTVFPDGKPSPRLRARLDRAVVLYQDGYFPLILVSGGVGKEGLDEAKVMRAYLLTSGVPASAVLSDSTGTTTYMTAQSVAALMRSRKQKTVLVISQYFHIARTKLALQRFGVSSIYHARAQYVGWRDFYSIPREVVGWVDYSLRKYPKAT